MNRKKYLFLILLTSFFLIVFSPSAKAANLALDFDGKSQYVSLPFLNIGHSFSMELWFNSPMETSFLTLLKDNMAGDKFGSVYVNYNEEINSNILEWWIQSERVLYSGGLNAYTWYHFVLTVDGSQSEANCHLYLNGARVASRNLYPYFYNTLKIGEADNGNYFYGKVDELRIYSRALSSAEVLEHYQWQFSNSSGLAGYWNFNEGSGGIVYDSSGNGYNGIVYGATWADASEILPPPPASRPSAPAVINSPPMAGFIRVPQEAVWRGKKKHFLSGVRFGPLAERVDRKAD